MSFFVSEIYFFHLIPVFLYLEQTLFSIKKIHVTILSYKGVDNMKNFLIGGSMNLIRKEQPQLSDVKLAEIEYGLTGIYLSITKVIIILLIAITLGIWKEYFIFLFIFSIIRTNSYGIHLSKSWHCLIFSTLFFIGIPLLSMYVTIPFLYKYIAGILCSIYIFKYSPADTKKRPIINKQKRLRHVLPLHPFS